ncbi:MAG: HYR domain-containing protein, partial [Bacteroidota bacterium]
TFAWTGPSAFTSTVEDPASFVASTSVAGNYAITVTDANRCTGTATTALAVRTLPAVSVTTGPTCLGNNLSLSSTTSGGTSPYVSYAWSGPNSFSSTQEDPAAFSLTAQGTGTYTVTVTDNSGCTATGSSTIVGNNSPAITASNSGPICQGTQLTLTSTPQGGAGTYTFSWTGPAGSGYTSTAQNPAAFTTGAGSAGVYSVQVTDANGCTGTGSTTAALYSLPVVTVSNNGPFCIGSTALLTSVVTGGAGSYSYAWSGPSGFTSSVANPAGFTITTVNQGGIYSLTVTDANGCTSVNSTSMTVFSSGVPSVAIGSNSPVCASTTLNLTATPSGGAGLYTGYSWTGPAGFTSTQQNPTVMGPTPDYSGLYTVTLTDLTGCTASVSASIIVSGATLSISKTNVTCFGGNTGSATLSFTGGTPPYNYLWSTTATTSTITSLTAGTYTVTMTPQGSGVCTETASVQITQPTAISVTLTSSTQVCAGSTTGSATVSATGGTSPYTYQWPASAGSQTTAMASNLPAGSHTVTVTDNAMCTSTLAVTISVITDITAPTISCVSDQTKGTASLACAYTASGAEFNLTASSDNCGVTSTTYNLSGATTSTGSNSLAGVVFNKGITTVQWTASDAAANMSTCSFTVTVNDDDAPGVVCVTAKTKGTSAPACTYTASGTEFNPVSSSDNCAVTATTWTLSGVTTGTGSSSLAGVVFNKGVTTVEWGVADAAGNTGTCSFTVTVNDDDNPTLSCVANQTKGTAAPACNYTSSGTEFNLTASSDNCGITATTYTLGGVTSGTGSNSLSAVTFNKGATTVQWSVSDAAGNTSTCSFTVTVNDDDNPSPSCVSDQTSTTDAPACTYTTTGAEFDLTGSSDNCAVTATTYSLSGATTSTGSNSLSGVIFNKGVTTVRWMVADAAANSGTCTFTVTVNDDDAPGVVCVPAKTKGTVAPVCTYTASGTEFNPTGSSDNCAVTATNWTLSGVTTGTGSSTLAGVVFNSGVTTVEWRVSDAAGNTGTCSFTVTVNDDDVPTVTCVSDKTSFTMAPACTYTASGNEFNPAGSSDNCGVTATTYTLSGVTVATGSNSLSGTVFNKGLTTVIWKVSDSAGNTGTCSFSVTVNDDDVPTVVCNNLTVNLDPVTAQATVSAAQLTVNSSDACGSITSSVSSWGLNPATCTGAVCLSGGTSFPILRNGPGTSSYLSTSCLESSRNESWYYFQVTSAGTINQTISLSPAANVDYACWGPFSSIAAGCGNLIPANQKSCDYSAANGGTMNFTAATGYYIIVVTNFDNQAGNVTLGNNTAGTPATVATCGSLNTSQASYVYDPSDMGQNTVTVQVTDAAGNSGTCTSVVTVQVVDTTPPVALCKNIAVNLLPDNTASIISRDVDNGSSDNIAVSSFALSKSQFACADIGSSVVTMTVTDVNGNTSACNTTVTVNDIVPPVFADPSDVSLSTSAASTCPTTASISLNASQSTPVTTANSSFTFTVHGKTQNGPTSYSDNCATGSDLKLYCWAINDNFGGTANTCSRQIQVTWRVYDKNNANYTEQTQLFTIQDNTIPSFARPADITINADATCTPNRLPANTGDVTNESDNCSSAIQATYTDGPNIGLTCAGEYYFDRTWSLQDNCGNAAASQVQRITVQDRTSPVVSTTDNVLNPDIENYSCGASYTFNAGPQLCFLNKTIAKPEWVDACGGVVNSAFSANNSVTVNNYGSFVSADFPVGTTIVTFTAQDCPGNTALCSLTVTINDTQSPTLTGCPQNQTLVTDPNSCARVLTLVIPTASDNCAVTSVTHTLSGATTLSGNEFPNQLIMNFGVTSVTYVVLDAAGNSRSCNFVVTVNDQTPPSITCPSNKTVSTNSGVCYYASANGLLDPSVTDNCSTTSAYLLSGQTTGSGASSLNGVTISKGLSTVVWTATDQGGNTASCSFNVTVNDTEPPVVPSDAGTVVACLSAAVTPAIPSATDNCSGTVSTTLVSVVDNPGSLTCEGTRTYTYSYTDASGNTAGDTWIYTYTVEYLDFNMPADAGSTVGCIAQATQPSPPAVNDNCGNALTPSGPVTGGTYTSCEGTRTWTWTYTDCEGNSHPWVYTYTIERNDFTVPANGSSTVSCIALATTPAPPSVNDNCGNALTPSGPVTGGTYTSCEGTRTFTYTYTDCEGNTHPWVYTYTIERENFTMPSDGSMTTGCLAQATQPVPPAVNDQCGNPVIPVGPVVSDNYNGCEGTRTYIWIYADCEGNSHNWSYVYTIERENFTVPAENSPVTVSCLSQIPSQNPPAASDACGNNIVPTGPVTGGTYNGCEGTRTYTWTYTDCEGNSNSWTSYYVIDDNVPPVVSSTNSTFNPDIENYSCGASYTFMAGQSACIINKSLSIPAWTDNCSGAVSSDQITSNGIILSQLGDILIGNFPVGLTIVTFRASDCAGNMNTCNLEIRVNDGQNPTISGCPTNKVENTDAGTCTKTSSLVIPTPGDNCAVSSVIYTVTGSTTQSGTEFPNQLTFNIGLSSVTYAVYDPAGNSATCSFSVFITDNQPLTLACPSNQTVNTDTGLCTHKATGGIFDATITDNCPIAAQTWTLSGATAATGSGTINDVLFSKGVTTVRWVAVDQGGTSKSCSFTVTVTDNQVPVVPASASSTVPCISAMTTPIPPAGLDNCNGTITGVLAGVTNTPSTLTCEGTRVYSYTYTDAGGNVATWTYTYTLESEDFNIPPDQSSQVSCPSLASLPVAPAVNDNCGNPVTPVGPAFGGSYDGCEGTITYTWMYTDCEGNTHPWVYTYQVERENFSMPQNGNSTVSCVTLATQPVPPVILNQCGNQTVSSGPVTGGNYDGCEGTVSYTWMYSDCEGNTNPWTYTYTVERISFQMPANGTSTVSCVLLATPPTPPVVNDQCGSPITPVGPTPGGTYNGCEGTRTYTWVYTDCEGNSRNWVYTYTIEQDDFAIPANGASTVACISNAVVPTPPAVNDHCGNAIIPVGPSAGGTYTTCEGTRTYTWVYTDCEGNSYNWTYTYTIDDNTAPVVSSTNSPSSPDIKGYSCGATFTYPAGQSTCIINKSIAIPTWTDDCGGAVVRDFSTNNSVVMSQIGDLLVGNFPTGTTVVRFTGTDCAGNSSLCTIAVVVQDGQSPTITGCPQTNITTATDPNLCTKVLSLVIPTAGDNCTVASVTYSSAGATSLSGTEFPNQLTFNLGVTVVTYTVSDASGNTRTCSYSVSVTDNQPVTVSCPSSQSFNTGSGLCIFVSTNALTPVVTDNCPVQSLSYTMIGASSATGSGTLSGFTFNKGLTMVTWKATDQGGSTATCSFFVTVNDREAPVVPADAGSTVNCLSAVVIPAAPPATDNCSGSVAGVLMSVVDNPSPLVCEGTRTYTYSYTDAAGNAATDTWVYTYTVNYNTALVPPASITNQATCAADAVDPGAPANIQDACGRTIAPVLVGSANGPNNTSCSGTVVWRYRYTACDGTTADWTCTWTYQDDQAPVATLPASGYETCFTSEASAFQALLQLSVVSDNCTGTQALRTAASLQFVPYNDGNNCNDGNVIIRFSDECGNGPTVLTFTGIRIDNVAPALVSFPNSTVQPVCIETLPAPNPAGVVASDNCDSSVSVTFEGDQLPTTCQGTLTRTYKLTDDCGNTRLAQQYFNVISDRLAPVMTPGSLLPGYTTVAQGEAAAIAATTIADDCTPYADLIIQTAVTGVCPATITVTATDKCGHSSQIYYTNICLGDIVSLTVPASNRIVNCENEQSELTSWLNTNGGAQVTGAGLLWTYTPVQFGPIDCVTHSKSATVTFKAQSPYGSFVTTTATFTVRDIQPPVVQNIPPQILTCASQIPVSDTELIIATDNCDNSLTIKLFSSSSNGGFACGYSPRTELRTYSVTDDYCNTIYVTYQITAADNVPPTFTAPPNATVNIASNCSYDSSVQTTGDVTNEADNCSTGLNATFTDVTIQGGGPGIRFTINRTWRLTDNCGNSAIPRVQTIHVIDNLPPALTCPANVNVTGATIGTNVCAWRGVNTTPVSSDNCGLPVVTYTITGNFAGASSGNKTVNGVIFLEGVSTVTYTSTDGAGNKTTCSFTVTVNCTTVSGRIIWEHNDISGIKDVTVRLRKGTVLAGSVLSDLNGNYTLTPTSTGTHTITPVKNINRLNGVTAADATVILQHLNGSPLITDPYKKVAADVNRSGAISTQDANVITQALAGNASALAAFNVFWRFIPTSYVMPVTGSNIVASFPESITLNLTGADVTGQNFFGVKLGDLNGSANPLAMPATGPLVWTVRDEVLQAGREYELQFAANGFSNLAAFQFGLDFDPSQLQFLSQSNTAAVPMSDDNFGAGNAG